MTGRKKFILSLTMITAIFILFIVFELIKSYFSATPRTVDSLFNQYYRLIIKNPDAAKKALEIILSEYPNNKRALREMGNWYMRQGDIHSAYKEFQYAHSVYPEEPYFLNALNQLNKTLGVNKVLLAQNTTNNNAAEKKAINDIMNVVIQKNNRYCSVISAGENEPIIHIVAAVSAAEGVAIASTEAAAEGESIAPAVIAAGTMTKHDKLLNEFYQAKNQKNSEQAWIALNQLIILYPNDVQVLKEAGYYALSENKVKESIEYFKRVYDINRDPYIALQLGYLYDGLNYKPDAYYYFDLATHTSTLEERLKAELAKTNLRGLQTKYLPEPYFADFLFYPFYHSRFRLMIYPLIARVGAVLNKDYNVKAYLSYRRTTDNKSRDVGQLPQIFEDNSAITAVGIQATPYPKIPIVTFMEAGKADDLVYQDRSRWRSDFRGGLVYYGEWGKAARYTFKPSVTLKANADLYSDLIYFTRYRNTIFTFRARPGVEVFRSGSTSLNVYLKTFISEDYDRIFYNNYLEMGPSVAFTPSDRYNVTFRYECLRGYYLPGNGDGQVNPYGPRYHNNMIFLDTYLSV